MQTPSYTVVFLRHGQSVFNQENIFTGWLDVSLSQQGINEAIGAGKILKEKNYKFDIAFCSKLKRSIQTFNEIAEQLDIHHIPVHKHYRLNERHYGALQGLNKSETAEKHGEQQVKIWRRSYDVRPPTLALDSPMYPGNDEKYKELPKDVLPAGECLKDTVERVLPYWQDVIGPAIIEGKKVLVCAHGNSLRALVKYLDNVSEEDIMGLDIPTGVPLVYELDSNLRPIKHYYLSDEQELELKIKEVQSQGKSK